MAWLADKILRGNQKPGEMYVSTNTYTATAFSLCLEFLCLSCHMTYKSNMSGSLWKKYSVYTLVQNRHAYCYIMYLYLINHQEIQILQTSYNSCECIVQSYQSLSRYNLRKQDINKNLISLQPPGSIWSQETSVSFRSLGPSLKRHPVETPIIPWSVWSILLELIMNKTLITIVIYSVYLVNIDFSPKKCELQRLEWCMVPFLASKTIQWLFLVIFWPVTNTIQNIRDSCKPWFIRKLLSASIDQHQQPPHDVNKHRPNHETVLN